MRWYTYVGPYLQLTNTLTERLQYDAGGAVQGEENEYGEFACTFLEDLFMNPEYSRDGLFIPQQEKGLVGVFHSNNDENDSTLFDMTEPGFIINSINAFANNFREAIVKLSTLEPNGVQVRYGLISYFL